MFQLQTLLKLGMKGAKYGRRIAVKHLPTILTAAGTIGVGIGVWQTAKKAPEAKEALDKVKEEWDAIEDQEKRVKADYYFKRIRVGAKYFWVVFLIIGGSITCFWIANRVSLKRLTSALTAAGLSAKAKEELENKIKELDGDKHLQKIKDEISSDALKAAPPVDQTIECRPGESWFYEPGSRQYFRSSYERIRQTRNNIRDALEEMIFEDGNNAACVPVNEFLMDIGAAPCDFGKDLCFAVEIKGKDISKKDLRELVNDACEIGFTSDFKDGVPVGVIRYDCSLRHTELFDRCY